jgi:tetratricopeptide (TPR) repeat protein
VAYVQALLGHVPSSREHIDRALTAAEQLGDPGQLTLSLALRGWLAFLAGDWKDARSDLERARALIPPSEASRYSVYPMVFLARLSLAKGDRENAATIGAEAAVLAERSGYFQGLCWASEVLAELDILEGSPDAAIVRLVPLLDRPGMDAGDVATLLPVLAWAHLDHDELEQAAEEVRQAINHARSEDMQLVLVDALWVQSLVALRQGSWQDAAASLEEGLGIARSMPHPYAEARFLSVDGQRLAAQGKPVAARERLAAARGIFRRLGAAKDIEQTEQAVAHLV